MDGVERDGSLPPKRSSRKEDAVGGGAGENDDDEDIPVRATSISMGSRIDFCQGSVAHSVRGVSRAPKSGLRADPVGG